MASPYSTIKQQTITWAIAFFVGFMLIYYEGAPVIPVIVGCLLVPGIAAFRSWSRSKKRSH